LRKVKRAVKEFITFKYEDDKEKYNHAGFMGVRGYSVHEVKDELTVIYVRDLKSV
jgi:hypothetical protein